MRLVQHKREAYWFYRYLSEFYDNYVNPFFWNERMRDEALVLADLGEPDLDVVDVGSGTGFTTAGIVKHVHPVAVTSIDQSPHQMAHARRRPELRGVTFLQGDAEDLPFPTDQFDRYVSAGSIEYWPEPARGIAEAYRVVKPGGKALMIGPIRPSNPVARAAADTWMLFPEEHEYIGWFRDAGFVDLKQRYIRPTWVQKQPYAIALVGTKPEAGASPADLPPRKLETSHVPVASPAEALKTGARVVAGSLAGGLFIPMALYGQAKDRLTRRLLGRSPAQAAAGPPDPLTPKQRNALIGIGAAAALWAISSVLRSRD
ncbi:MAG: methyltransferase domain-containing protein [Bacteroidota bacterium]